jgi:hypothetical protein
LNHNGHNAHNVFIYFFVVYAVIVVVQKFQNNGMILSGNPEMDCLGFASQ